MSGTSPGSAPPRPRQVLVSGVIAAGACALLVLTLFDALTRMRSAEVRDSVAESLSRHNDLGLRVDDVIMLMRGVTFLSGALAAAGVVLAVYALQRHRGARVGLTVVAVILVFTATLVAGLLPLLVGLAVLRLWNRDARDWFDGRPARERRPAGPSASRDGAGAPYESGPVSASWPPPEPRVAATPPAAPAPTASTPPTSSDGDHERPAPAPYAFGTVPARSAPVGGPRPVRERASDGARPAAVVLACWLTWVLCGLLALFCLLLAVALTSDSSELLRELQANPRIAAIGRSDRELLEAMWLLVAIGATWALTAIALAGLAYHRVDGARVALVVSAILAALVGLVVVPVGWLHAAGAVTTAVLLLRQPARDWYAGRSTSPPSGPTAPPPGGPPARQQPPPPPPPPGQSGPPAPGPPGPSGPSEKPPVW